MSEPSIVLVPGSFALPEFYDKLLDAVKAKGYDIQALHPPSVGLKSAEGRDGPPPTMYDDAAFIAGEVEKLADQGKDVVLVAHSYGGVPTTQSIQGLSKEARSKQGKQGGIARLAYMTCVIPAVGANCVSVLADLPEENRLDLKVDELGWMYHDQFAAAAAIVIQNVPSDEGVALIKRMPKHSAVSFAGELTYPGFKDVPVSYLFCEQDKCVIPEVQRAGIDMIETESGRKVDVTSIAADHCPMTTATEQVVDWVSNLAAKAVNGQE